MKVEILETYYPKGFRCLRIGSKREDGRFLVLRGAVGGRWTQPGNLRILRKTIAKDKQEILSLLTKLYGPAGFEVIGEPMDCFRSLLGMCAEE